MNNEEAQKVFKRAKDDAIRFYDEEKQLSPEERGQLYVFFEQQFRRMMLLSSVGFAAGVAIPFIVRKKGKLMTPGLPIFGGIIGSSLMPALFNQTVFDRQLNDVQANYGTESAIYKTIKVVPDPVTKSYFWSSYFKRSSEDPTLRIRDPRMIDDANAPLVVHKPVTTDTETGSTIAADVPRYGRPDYPDSSKFETAVSSWDKVRTQTNTTTSTESDINNDVFQTPIENASEDPFEIPDTKRNIGDSYGEDGSKPQSAWDTVRKSNH